VTDLIEHKRSKRELAPEIATPFRVALFAGNYVVAWNGKMTTRDGEVGIAMHIIGTDLRSLCGARRPSGEVSNMTEYAVTDQTCRKCLRRFVAETGFVPDEFSDFIPALAIRRDTGSDSEVTK
jgi:hypothetical protein